MLDKVGWQGTLEESPLLRSKNVMAGLVQIMEDRQEFTYWKT